MVVVFSNSGTKRDVTTLLFNKARSSFVNIPALLVNLMTVPSTSAVLFTTRIQSRAMILQCDAFLITMPAGEILLYHDKGHFYISLVSLWASFAWAMWSTQLS